MSRGRIAFALLLCVPFVFLFARTPPPPVAPGCLHRLTIAGAAHFTHVCDSVSIVSEMQNLEHFLTQDNAWRARPVYIVVAAGLATALSPAAALVNVAAIKGRATGVPAGDFTKRFTAYFALIVFNFIVLGLALILGRRLVGEKDGLLAIALGAAIVTSDLVHGLFWTQHSNFMNLLIPVGCIFYFVQGCRARQMQPLDIAVAGLAAGAAVLMYAYAVLWLPAFVVGSLYRDWRMSQPPSAAARNLIRMLPPFAVAGCGPVVAWWALNRWWLHVTVSYEAESFRQFVWLADAWRDGDLGAAIADKWHQFFPDVLVWAGWPALAVLIVVAALLLAGRDKRTWSMADFARDPIIIAVLLTIVSMLVFNFLQGYYQPRLVNGLTLALFVALARTAQMSGHERTGAWLLFGISAGQVVDAFISPALSLT